MATQAIESDETATAPLLPNVNARQKLQGVQAGRAIAALLVVVTHMGALIAEPRFYNWVPGGGVLDNFGVGVDFFFVLSGFVIAWVHWGDIGRRDRLRSYAISRLTRIYPPYLIVLLPLSALYFTIPSAGIPSQHDPVNLIFSVLLLPYPVHPILGVAWTLVHEMLFYMMFGAIILIGRRAIWLLPVWAVAIVAVQLAFRQPPFPLDILFNPFNLEFLLGIACSLWLKSHRTVAPAWLAGIAVAVFVTAMLFGGDLAATPFQTRAIFGLASAAYIIGIVEVERQRGLAVPRWLTLLGAASYAIYLVHAVVMSFTLQGVTHIWKTAPVMVAIPCMLCAAICAGVAYHLLVEQPVMDRLKARFGRRRPA